MDEFLNKKQNLEETASSNTLSSQDAGSGEDSSKPQICQDELEKYMKEQLQLYRAILQKLENGESLTSEEMMSINTRQLNINLVRNEKSWYTSEYRISDDAGNQPFIIHYSFLDKKQPFLKKGIDLLDEFQGTPLDELISLKSTEFDGVVLDQEQIPIITNNIYESLVSEKHPNLRIKNSRVLAFLYTLCKLDDIVLFQVWKINTQKVNEARNAWEERYNKNPGSCCRLTYNSRRREDSTQLFTLALEDLLKSESLEDLADVLKSSSLEDIVVEKNCLYKTPYIDCSAIFHSHIFNNKNQKTEQFSKNILFNMSIAEDFKFGNCLGARPFFCYNGVDTPSSLTCTCFYDSIVFENTPENTVEKNFQSFLLNSLSTCYSIQNKIRSSQQSSQETQQRLLFVSLYFDLE